MLQQSVFRRNRFILALYIVGIIALGLASRKYPFFFPTFMGKYPGDALWSVMVYYVWAWFFPTQSPKRIALITVLISFGVEFSQLVQYPWLNSIRHTTLGHLVLGTTFSEWDLMAYSVGVLLSFLIDYCGPIRKRLSV
jgi:hypothetical protein